MVKKKKKLYSAIHYQRRTHNRRANNNAHHHRGIVQRSALRRPAGSRERQNALALAIRRREHLRRDRRWVKEKGTSAQAAEASGCADEPVLCSFVRAVVA
jgi:hypothetical protein